MDVCEEMQKLRSALDKMGVEWDDASEEWLTPPYSNGKSLAVRRDYICRTRFHYKGNRFSVINGFGTYGGYDSILTENMGLLEVMVNGKEPSGFLTAATVLKMIKGAQKDGTKTFKS